jgi:molybdenum cofactor cytidylyltransferase
MIGCCTVLRKPESAIGVVLLAAGGSSRLGTPKQLLSVGTDTLLGHAARTALASRARRVLVVVGAHADACRQALVGLPVELVVHPDWADGQASSLRAGLTQLRTTGVSPAAAIVMLCDQPWVSPALLDTLIDRYLATAAPVVASRYANGVVGPPALFDGPLFGELEALRGDVGAKRVIVAHAAEAETVPFPAGGTDIDTEADRQAFLQTNREHEQGIRLP